MKIRSKLFYSYLFFLIVYAGFTLLPAPSPVTLLRYHVSALSLRIIDITIIVLMAAIWFVGFYGYAKLRDYSSLIKDSKDGKQVAKITRGIFFLVMWLPISSVTSAVLNYIAAHHLNLLPAVTIIDNYVSLILPLAGFIFISRGSRGLSEIVRQRPTHLATSIMTVLLVYIGLINYHLIAATPDRSALYHMSIWLIMLTLVAPYICMWFMGLLATYEIYSYRLKVKGVVYRRSWSRLAFGLGWLIVMSISFQFLTTISGRLSHLSIYLILVIVYALLLVLSLGFVFIALGTRALQRIEEV